MQKVFTVKMDEQLKYTIQLAAQKAGISTNAMAVKLLKEGAIQVIRSHEKQPAENTD